jgi:hypothetical protein
VRRGKLIESEVEGKRERKMTEKAKRSTKIDKTDPKYIARRLKNQEAVSKCRLKKALEDEQKQRFRRKLERRNNYLEGQIRELKKSKKLFMELLLEQAKRLGRELTKEQQDFIDAQNLSEYESSEESAESSSSSSSRSSSSEEDDDDQSTANYHNSQHNRVNEPPLKYSQSTDYR